MRTIQKKISLENFTSRMPSLIPAYDRNGMQREFAHLTSSFIEPLTNYGMLPFNVQIDSIIVDGKEIMGEYANKWFTYAELTDLFHYLSGKAKRKNLCILDNHINGDNELTETETHVYNWLLKYCFPYLFFDDYNNITSEVKKYWGTDKLSYQDVILWNGKMKQLQKQCNESSGCCTCLEYEERGGDTMLNILNEWYNDKVGIIICKNEDLNHDYIYDVNDNATSVSVKVLNISENKISEHSFEIHQPTENILGNNRYIRYGQIITINGNTYVHNPYNIEIIDNKLIIPCLVTNDKHHLTIAEPYFNIFFTLTNTIDDMGEMSSLCEEWEHGYDYSEGGTTNNCLVYYNNDNWILNNKDYPGYIFSETYEEIYFGNENGMTEDEKYNYTDEEQIFSIETDNNNQWTKYLDFFTKYINEYAKKYAYKNNKLIINPTPLLMCDSYDINTNNGLFYHLSKVNEKIYPMFSGHYITVDKMYLVLFEGENLYPYTYLNNKKYYALLKDNTYVFVFKKIKGCEFTEEYEIKTSNSLYYKNGVLFLHKDDENIIHGIVNANGEEIWFIKNQQNQFNLYDGKVYKFLGEKCEDISQKDCTFSGYSIDNNCIKICKPYVEYNSTIMSGYTNSKLDTLKYTLYNVYDNLGNYINGLLPYDSIDVNGEKKAFYAFHPKMGDWLGIPYIPNSTASLEQIKENVYWGNFLKQMTFTKNDGSIVICTTEAELKTLENEIKGYNTIECEIEYYCGTILTEITNENVTQYSLIYENNKEGKYYGIKYVEKLHLVKKQATYYYDTITNCIVNYWSIEPNLVSYINEDYNVMVSDTRAQFEYRIKPFKIEYGYQYLDNKGENFIFYKINPESKSVIYQNDKYMIENDGVNRFFSIPLINNMSSYQNIKYYRLFDNGEKYFYKWNGTHFTVEFPKSLIDETAHPSEVIEQNMYYDNVVQGNVYAYIPLTTFIILNESCGNEIKLNDEYFDYSHEMTISPLFRKEYNLGKTTRENVQTDIYIDRGTNRAIDFHLRLMETKSMESLIQLGNGFFNII